MSANSTIEFQWNKSIDSIVNSRVLRGGATALFMAETWHRLYMPFVPRLTGTLSTGSVSKGVQGLDTGFIHHQIIYASFQYLGSGHNFSRHVHPMATSHWDQAAKAAGKVSALVNDVRAYLGAK